MTDGERLDWLETQQGSALVSDDDQCWAVVTTGMQDVVDEGPCDLWTSFFVEADQWQPTVREAIDAAMRAEEDDR